MTDHEVVRASAMTSAPGARMLLACGIAAGPLFMLMAVIQALNPSWLRHHPPRRELAEQAEALAGSRALTSSWRDSWPSRARPGRGGCCRQAADASGDGGSTNRSTCGW